MNFTFFQHSQPKLVVDGKPLCAHCEKPSTMTEKKGLYLCKSHNNFVVTASALATIIEHDVFNGEYFVFPACNTCNKVMLELVKNTASIAYGKLFFKCSCKNKTMLMFLSKENKVAEPCTNQMSDKYFELIGEETMTAANNTPSFAKPFTL